NCRRATTPWAGRADAVAAARSPGPALREACRRPCGSRRQGGPELGQHAFELFQANRLFDRAGHGQTERFTEAEGGFKHAPVEPGYDQHRRAIVVLGEEADELD